MDDVSSNIDGKQMYSQVKNWVYRNGRQIEVAMWNCIFEKGPQKAVIDALMEYQNEDGGFGHTLEPDNWNPESTPSTTYQAIEILSQIGFKDMEHPIYQGIFKYLQSEQDLLSYGWRFTVPSNENYPHAPWWNYSEEENSKEYYGITAELCSFILQYGKKEWGIYQKALHISDALIHSLMINGNYGDMGLQGYVKLLATLHECGHNEYDLEHLEQILADKITNAIENDTEKWVYYGVRPSNFIHSPASPYYERNKTIMDTEIKYLITTKPADDVWAITWTWFDNMEKYEKYFNVSENWWKAIKAIEKMQLLCNFEIIEPTCE